MHSLNNSTEYCYLRISNQQLPLNNIILHIDKEKILLDQDELLSHFPNENEGIDDFTRQLTLSLSEKCLEIADPMGSYISMEALTEPDRDWISTAEGRFQTGRTIKKMMTGAEHYIFFIATAGPEPEELARKLMAEGQYLEGYIVDLIASALADGAAQVLHDQVKQEAASRALKITNRYSPGYCDWDVSEQQKLFALFPENCCDIALSESSLMSPIKSVSGIIGSGPKVSYRDYTCEICSMVDCHFRRTRATHGSPS